MQVPNPTAGTKPPVLYVCLVPRHCSSGGCLSHSYAAADPALGSHCCCRSHWCRSPTASRCCGAAVPATVRAGSHYTSSSAASPYAAVLQLPQSTAAAAAAAKRTHAHSCRSQPPQMSRCSSSASAAAPALATPHPDASRRDLKAARAFPLKVDIPHAEVHPLKVAHPALCVKQWGGQAGGLQPGPQRLTQLVVGTQQHRTILVLGLAVDNLQDKTAARSTRCVNSHHVVSICG